VDAAAVQRHQRYLDTDLGALSEHPQCVGDQLHRMHTAKHLGQSALAAAECMCCRDNLYAALGELTASLVAQPVFAWLLGAVGAADADNLSCKTCLLAHLHQSERSIALAGRNHDVHLAFLCCFQRNFQRFLGVDSALLLKNSHKASSCSHHRYVSSWCACGSGTSRKYFANKRSASCRSSFSKARYRCR